MKIALLADVHANLPAIKAVLEDLKRRKAEKIWYLGDFTGYGPFPNEVVEVIKRSADKAIAGNYDQKVMAFPEKRKRWKLEKDPSKYFCFKWTFNRLTSGAMKYLAKLPSSISLAIKGRKYLLVHGSPEKIDEPLMKDTSRKRFLEIAGKVDADAVLCGHTHEFFDKDISGVRFINPGSIGRPFDGDPRASYAIMEIGKSGLSVKNIRIRYDIAEVLRKMKAEKFPEDVIQTIRLGRSLDEINEKKKKNSDKRNIEEEILNVARSCNYESGHSHQVTKLALKLFDELKKLHGLNEHHKLFLKASSLLHDVGWVNGQKGHHKASRDIILKSKSLPFDPEDRILIALIARYHRGGLPKASHKYYCRLDKKRKADLNMLASILRVADGLDRLHIHSVEDLTCVVGPKCVTLYVKAGNFTEEEKRAVKKKADLFDLTFKRSLILKWGKT